MKSTHTEYIVQHRVQDYWLDLPGGDFHYKSDALKRLEEIKQIVPTRDYRLVKRKCTIEDEELIHL